METEQITEKPYDCYGALKIHLDLPLEEGTEHDLEMADVDGLVVHEVHPQVVSPSQSTSSNSKQSIQFNLYVLYNL